MIYNRSTFETTHKEAFLEYFEAGDG